MFVVEGKDVANFFAHSTDRRACVAQRVSTGNFQLHLIFIISDEDSSSIEMRSLSTHFANLCFKAFNFASSNSCGNRTQGQGSCPENLEQLRPLRRCAKNPERLHWTPRKDTATTTRPRRQFGDILLFLSSNTCKFNSGPQNTLIPSGNCPLLSVFANHSLWGFVYNLCICWFVLSWFR